MKAFARTVFRVQQFSCLFFEEHERKEFLKSPERMSQRETILRCRFVKSILMNGTETLVVVWAHVKEDSAQAIFLSQQYI